jgi:hypothetical protein
MGSGVGEATGRMGGHMMEARHGVMMLGEEFGVHLPRGVSTFIASIGPVGAAMEAAFPFLAIILGATILMEHLDKVKAKAGELTKAQTKATEDTADTFDKLNDRMLQVGARADDLAGNHFVALQKQLELLDRQTLSGIIGEIDKMGAEADAAFSKLQSNWFMQLMMGRADVGPAKDELAGMVSEINKLKNTGADPGNATRSLLGFDIDHVTGQIDSLEGKMSELRAARNHAPTTTDRDMDTNKLNALQQQKELYQKNLATLQLMRDAASESVAINQGDKKNDTTAEGQQEAQRQASIYGEQQRGLDQRWEAEKRFYEDGKKSAKDALKDKIESQRTEFEANRAFNAEILEQAKQRAELQEKIAKEAAEHSAKDAELRATAVEKASLHQLAGKVGQGADDGRLAAEIKKENDIYQHQQSAYAMQAAGLDKGGKDYELKLKQINDRQEELTLAHENKITEIKNKAEEDRNARVIAAAKRENDEIARGLTDMVMRHQSFAHMLDSLGSQIASGMMENAIKSIMANDMTKESDAAAAARKAYLAGMHFPFPVNLVMAPALGAMAFASVMAFESGGIVPGVERGDVVNAKLTPGEGVLPKPLMDRINNTDYSSGNGRDVHVHVSPVYHLQALDTSGMRKILTKHNDVLMNHVHNEIRRRNG